MCKKYYFCMNPFLSTNKKCYPYSPEVHYTGPTLNIYLNMFKTILLSTVAIKLSNILVFTCLQYKSFENTIGKRRNCSLRAISLFQQCFLPVWKTFCHFHQILYCRLQTLSVWKHLKFVI